MRQFSEPFSIRLVLEAQQVQRPKDFEFCNDVSDRLEDLVLGLVGGGWDPEWWLESEAVR